MPIATDSALRGGAQPYDANTTVRTLDLTTADATITLVAGVYDLLHNGSGPVAVRIGATAVGVTGIASGAAEVTGFVIPAGAVATVVMDAGVLHAATYTSTATLTIVRKVLA